MLKVNVEVHPWWDHANLHTKTIGEVFIYNDGTGDKKKGNYIGVSYSKYNRISRTTTTQNYDRLTKNIWSLVRDILEGMGY
jgi:pectate lyase